jgi:hypothetical protein
VRPQFGPSMSRKRSSRRGPHVTLSFGTVRDILPRGFSTTISTLEVRAIGDGPLPQSLLCSVKI